MTNRSNRKEKKDRILIDNGHYVLTEEQWKNFTEALNAPVKDLPNVKKLFNEPTIFTEE